MERQDWGNEAPFFVPSYAHNACVCMYLHPFVIQYIYAQKRASAARPLQTVFKRYSNSLQNGCGSWSSECNWMFKTETFGFGLKSHWNCIGYSFWIFKRCTKMSDQTTSLHLFRVFNGDILHLTPPLYTPTLHQKKPFENGSNGCICVNYAKFGYFQGCERYDIWFCGCVQMGTVWVCVRDIWSSYKITPDG